MGAVVRSPASAQEGEEEPTPQPAAHAHKSAVYSKNMLSSNPLKERHSVTSPQISEAREEALVKHEDSSSSSSSSAGAGTGTGTETTKASRHGKKKLLPSSSNFTLDHGAAFPATTDKEDAVAERNPLNLIPHHTHANIEEKHNRHLHSHAQSHSRHGHRSKADAPPPPPTNTLAHASPTVAPSADSESSKEF
jgi:hypothetical protein